MRESSVQTVDLAQNSCSVNQMVVKDRTRVQKQTETYKIIHMDGILRAATCTRGFRAEHESQNNINLLLFEVVPYDLECLDGMCILFTIFHRENSEH